MSKPKTADLEALLESLHAAGIEFIVVGGTRQRKEHQSTYLQGLAAASALAPVAATFGGCSEADEGLAHNVLLGSTAAHDPRKAFAVGTFSVGSA